VSAAPATWECRVCGRRVPRRVDECFCGARREQMAALEQRDEERSGRRFPIGVVLPLLLVGLLGGYALRQATREDAAPSGTPAPKPPTSELAPVRRIGTPPPSFGSAASDTLTAPLREPQAATESTGSDKASSPETTPAARATPVALPSPESDEREEAKTAALAAYSAQLQRLSESAARMAQRLRVYQSECVGQRIGAGITNCGELEASIRRSLTDVETGLEAAEDQARRSWVAPGHVRDARGRTYFGTREWEEALRGARQLRP
jgi:hypothetical protein